MKILADENIPYAEALFSNLGEVKLLPGRSMTASDLTDIDVLLTRSVTKVNASLLDGNAVKFVGTCTIGTDHIDKHYLQRHHIGFSSAPGCNALGVVQYDICALAHLDKLDSSLRYAVVGCGNVGRRVYQYLVSLGLDCIGVDPHLSKNEIPNLEPFEKIFDCDVICLHTPLVLDGDFPTESLIGERELQRLKPDVTLLNAGRGECIDNPALLEHLKTHPEVNAVLDVWKSEPRMNPELFDYVKIGTPHIAGYSFEGRVNGSTMIFEALAAHLGRSNDWISSVLNTLRQDIFGKRVELQADSVKDLVLHTYDIQADHEKLKAVLQALPESFDQLRKSYFKRREFGHYICTNDAISSSVLRALGFKE